MDTLLTIALVLMMVGLFYFLLRKKKRRNYPPGPGYGLPIIGHMAYLGKSPHKTLMDWEPVYGPIVSVDFGSFPTVAISDPKLIKEALADWRFAGRPDLPLFKDRSGGVKHGILFSEGEEWMEVRRFTMRHLRDFGFGKKSMEKVLHEEVSVLVDRLQKLEGSPTVFRTHLNTAVLNSIWCMIASERFEHDDPKLNQLLDMLTTNIEDNNFVGAISSFVPWIAKCFPSMSGHRGLITLQPAILDFLRNELNVHRESIIFGQPRDLMDAYIEETNSCNDPKSFFYGDLGEQVMLMVCLDLFIAGSETTSTTMAWFGLYMAAFPAVQEKLHREILDLVGKSRLPSLEDKAKMPFTEAVLLEVMRISSFLPLGVFHSTLEDVELGGYIIPKDTMILTNLYSCNHDVEYWGDPEVFRPERFLSSDGQTVIRHEHSIPFSTGKRVCLGENLARAELFIFSTAICQRFKLAFDPQNSPKSLEPHISFVLNPQPHKLILTERLN